MLLTHRKTWKMLEEHAQSLQYQTALHHPDSALLQTASLSLNYTHQAIDATGVDLLVALAEECQLSEWIKKLTSGYPLNRDLPALHTALRRSVMGPVLRDCPIQNEINLVLAEMAQISNEIRAGKWLGDSGKPIANIVNLGIGGSMLGPQFCVDTLADYRMDSLKFHFISDFDNAACERVLRQLDPETTLFIVSSKSFATTETLWNAQKILEWGSYKHFSPAHFIAVTARSEKASELGFQRVLPIWPWIGGRFSICSAINLITCIAIGYEHFTAFLRGAEEIDLHFSQTEARYNLPIMLGLLGLWNNNHLKMHNLLILTYAQSLEWFVPYLQQLEMESNGKSVDREGREVNYATVPIIWGGSGNQAQHSYFQMLSQGTHRLSADLISIATLDDRVIAQHTEALFSKENVEHHSNRYIPCNHIQLVDNSPYSIGSLIALYEHKVFVQAVLWNLNPFDQPGVERMKEKMEQWTIHKTTLIL